MSSVVLELRGVSRQFGGLRALSSIDLNVSRGETVGIMGANGAGKTTLFSLIAGHVPPSSGDILIDGKSILGLRPYEICRRGVGRTFQTVRPFGGLSVFENVLIAGRFGTKRRAMADASVRATALIEAIGLADRAQAKAETLTLSAQKRLEVIRAVATGAHIILLDEVLAGLTPNEVREMLGVIGKLQKDYDLTLLMIEHVMRALMEVSNRILVLHHGEAIAIGDPAQVRSDARVLECYLGKDE